LNILVWGLGYVGTVSAACLADMGHDVIGIDPNPVKVESINRGGSPIIEPGLDELVGKVVLEGRLRATEKDDVVIAHADVSIICVGTPSAPDGSAILKYVKNVAADIGHGLGISKNYHVVILRSTVSPGVTRNIVLPILEEHSKSKGGEGFGIVACPEFLREGSAIRDFNHPPYKVIGEFDNKSGEIVEELFKTVNAPTHRVRPEEAELLKLINNAYHALKIGFANEVGRISDRVGVDSHAVMDMLCADFDLNISTAYLKPGFAFGGSCLPKDLRGLIYDARQLGEQLPILEAILPSNQLQIEAVRKKIHDLEIEKVAILGLSFKPHTDDLRESPIIHLIRDLWQDGIDVTVYDPDVNPNEMLGSNRAYMERQLPQIDDILFSRLEDALNGCQAVIVSQNRPEFVAALQKLANNKIILDLVRLENGKGLMNLPSYRGISW